MGMLVVHNQYLKGDIYKNHLQSYVANIKDCTVMTNGQLIYDLPDVKGALFLDKDIFLAKRLEEKGIKCYNSSKSIEICDSKALTYLALKKAGVKTPNTIIPPFTYDNVGYDSFEFLCSVKYPLVIKECFGSFGEGVYLANDYNEAVAIISKCKKPLLQEFISQSSGTDIRVVVCGGKVIACMRRYSTNGDFRSNIFLGAAAEAYTISSEMQDLAVRASIATGCDYCGVDILLSGHVLEVNSNPHLKAVSEISKINCYKEIADYVSRQL